MFSSKGIKINRQAIVLIHGIGEQRPMDTLREFVQAIAPTIKNSSKPSFYSKPHVTPDNYDLRRLTSHKHSSTYKTDYFEFYWAHLVQGTKLIDIVWWVRYLFIRPPTKVPIRLRAIYYSFWIGLVFLIAGIVFVGPEIKKLYNIWLPFKELDRVKLLLSSFLGLFGVFITTIIINYLGDAVRYFNPLPQNIAQRQQIRQAGLDLLERLHTEQEDGQNKYDRIIVVGHSLGSVIAYDLVNLFWYAKHKSIPTIDPKAILKAEQAAQEFKLNQDLNNYQQSQFDLWQSQYKNPGSWRISDLITLGSPLSFADLYIADGPAALQQKQNEREFAVSPPVTEVNKNGTEGFSYSFQGKKIMHHGAAFSLTRWTNACFHNDFVGGNVTCFGSGVKNILLTSKLNPRLPFASHTHYWRLEEIESINTIRQALQLRIFENSVT